jgi:glycosyltransferase involved in cell wall biosynthesis
LVIAGIDPADRGFCRLMDHFGLSDDEVIRLGFVEPPYDWIAGAELCVLTSRYEGFSNFLLEAAALGKRIVSTDCPGGNRELLAVYGNNVTVAVDDVDALAKALASERCDIPREGARAMLAPFEWETVAAKYLEELFPDRLD